MTIDTTLVKIAGIPWRWMEPHWRTSTALFNLSLDALHVWRGHVDSWARRLDAGDDPLTETEQRRADSIRNIRRRHQFLAARTLARVLINHYFQHGAARVIEHDGGRMGVEAPPFSPPLFLSISHRDNLFIVAAARRRCAVDLEKTKDIHNYSRVARQLLPDEYHLALLHCDESPLEQARLFIKYWTALETRYKLHGEGSFLHYLRKLTASTCERHDPPLWARHFAAYPGYIGALAVCNDAVAPVFYDADAVFHRG